MPFLVAGLVVASVLGPLAVFAPSAELKLPLVIGFLVALTGGVVADAYLIDPERGQDEARNAEPPESV
jgi:hypothetical protein